MKRQHNASHLRSGIHTPRVVRCMDCGGSKSTTPLSFAQAGWNVSTRFIRTKAGGGFENKFSGQMRPLFCTTVAEHSGDTAFERK